MNFVELNAPFDNIWFYWCTSTTDLTILGLLSEFIYTMQSDSHMKFTCYLYNNHYGAFIWMFRTTVHAILPVKYNKLLHVYWPKK